MRVFDLVAIGGVGIVAFGAGIFAKKAEASCANLAVFNDQKKHSGSSRGKSFTGFSNGQGHLTK